MSPAFAARDDRMAAGRIVSPRVSQLPCRPDAPRPDRAFDTAIYACRGGFMGPDDCPARQKKAETYCRVHIDG